MSSFSSVCDVVPTGSGTSTTTSTTLGVSAIAEDCRSIVVTWSSPDVSVTIERSTDNETWTTVLPASRVGEAKLRDTNLQPSTSYYYRVTPRCGP